MVLLRFAHGIPENEFEESSGHNVRFYCGRRCRWKPTRSSHHPFFCASPYYPAGWTYFQKIADAGDLSPMRKSIFLRQLPTIMEASLRVRYCHNILRIGSRVRGFPGEGLKMDAGLPLVTEAELGLG